jgi:hypothetical protein
MEMIKVTVFWVLTLCSDAGGYQCLKMKAASMVSHCIIIQHQNPEDYDLNLCSSFQISILYLVPVRIKMFLFSPSKQTKKKKRYKIFSGDSCQR